MLRDVNPNLTDLPSQRSTQSQRSVNSSNISVGSKFDPELTKQINFKDTWAIFKLLWFPPEEYNHGNKGKTYLALMFLMALFTVGAQLGKSEPLKYMTTALSSQQSDAFWYWFVILVVISALISPPAWALAFYVQYRFAVKWRKWLSGYLMHKFFQNQNYYWLHQTEETENVEQRMCDDSRNFINELVSFMFNLMTNLMQLIGSLILVARIDWKIIPIVFAYVVLGTTIAIFVFWRKLCVLTANVIRREAAFRYQVVRVHENAEEIAMLRGSAYEEQVGMQKFAFLYATIMKQLKMKGFLYYFQSFYRQIAIVLPYLIVANKILSGDMQYGVVTQLSFVFWRLLDTLTIIITKMDELSELAALGTRLKNLIDGFDSLKERGEEVENKITFVVGPTLKCTKMTLKPFPDKTLVRRLDFELNLTENNSILIVGESGVGKSSFLRTLAGLSTGGSGTIANLHDSRVAYLPQKAYITGPETTLRAQLCFPNSPHTYSNQELKDALYKVRLAHLLRRSSTTMNQANISDSIWNIRNSGITHDRRQETTVDSDSQEASESSTNNSRRSRREQRRTEHGGGVSHAVQFRQNADGDHELSASDLCGLDAVCDWSRELSGGEQQRIGFARLLLSQPRIAYLDESTSAVDVDNEENLYKHLQATGNSYVSIGHRTGLAKYHTHVLEFKKHGKWSMMTSQQYYDTIHPGSSSAGSSTSESDSEELK